MFIAAAVLSITASAVNATTLNLTNQDVTAYVAPPGALTYHETNPTTYSTAAVHPATCGQVSSGTKYPYGAIITTTTPIGTPGGDKSTFVVEDMGDVNCTRKINNKNFTSGWFDIYFGTNTLVNVQNALNFGHETVSYSVSWN